MLNDENEISAVRIFQSIGTGSLATLLTGGPSWLPVVTGVLALVVEVLRRTKSDRRKESSAARLKIIEEKLQSLPCSKANDCS
jgi:hypothetical protein